MNYICLLPLTSALLCVGLGAFTFSRNTRHPANIGFSLGLLCIALVEIGDILMLLSEERVSQAGVRLSVAGQALLPPAWLLFSIAFARSDYGALVRKWFPALAGLMCAAIFFILSSGPYGTVRFTPQALSQGGMDVFMDGTPLFTIGRGGEYFYIYMVLTMAAGLVNLENTIRSAKGLKRWKIKFVVIGVSSILAFFIYLSSQALLFKSLNAQVIPVTAIVIFISVSMMSLFVIRHRLLDVDIFVSRYVVYNSTAVLIIGVYFMAVGAVTYGIRYFRVPFNYFFTSLFLFTSFLALFLFFFVGSLKRKIEQFISRHFYSHKYEFKNKWMESIEKIGSKMDIEEIIRLLTEMISASMGARKIHIWTYDARTGFYICHGEHDSRHRRISPSHPLIRNIRAKMTPFLLDGTEQLPEISESGNGTPIKLCASLAVQDEIIGLLLVGEDISGEPYGQDDIDLLKAVCSQAAVQIKAVRLTEELMASREAEVMNRMSSFILHDLKNFTNSLSLVSHNARYNMNNPEFQKDAIRAIDSTVSRMKCLIEKLSDGPKVMELKKKETDIGSVIQNALEKIRPLLTAKCVGLASEVGALPAIDIDPDVMETVFINLLTNACEAVGLNGRIRIEALVHEGFISVSVSDNGGGISQDFIEKFLFRPFKTTKKRGFGIGLYQCKAIMEAHGGTIGAESIEGQGCTFTLKFPLTQGCLAS
ncbi:MAG: PEP-CTERM system histidine kinase PrsK [Deltaproteobacteria bacterium]|nr:PEP-CTERM system histidine kinase PrsK [Deltaproteobacteria bacterium]